MNDLFLDWKWQLKNLITDIKSLKTFLPSLMDNLDERMLHRIIKRYPLRITPYYISLCKQPLTLSDPILRQCLPSIDEITDSRNESDPFDEEKRQPVSGLICRYPGRALILVNNVCATFCRFCSRKRILGKRGFPPIYSTLPAIIDYLKTNKSIYDIILSGGDSLMLSTKTLKTVLESLSKIKSIKLIRIASRVPVTMPMKLFDKDLLDTLSGYDRIWLITHFNHPLEVTPISKEAVRNIKRLGIPIQNQSVLLRGVNDKLSIQKSLNKRLLGLGIRPYYLFHCDPVKGVTHFATSFDTDQMIYNSLKRCISGLGVPFYVIDDKHGKRF